MRGVERVAKPVAGVDVVDLEAEEDDAAEIVEVERRASRAHLKAFTHTLSAPDGVLCADVACFAGRMRPNGRSAGTDAEVDTIVYAPARIVQVFDS